MAKRIENTKRKSKQTGEEDVQNSPSSNNQDTAIFESAEVLRDEIDKSQEFVEKNKKSIITAIGVIVAVVLAFFAFKLYIGGQEQDAQKELSQAVFYFEKDSLDKALDGDGNNTIGMLKIIDQYGMTDAANLSNFYAGVAYLKQKDFDKAIEFLGGFSSSDYLVQARAYSLLGDAYMEKKDYSNAASFYKKASSNNANKEFTPDYLMKLALAKELGGDVAGAKEVYQSILEGYPLSREINDVKRNLARLK